MMVRLLNTSLTGISLANIILSSSDIFCMLPPSSNILCHISSLLSLCFLSIFTNVGFFLINVPLAVCSVNTLAAQGSIPGETLPASLLLLTVGATARK